MFNRSYLQDHIQQKKPLVAPIVAESNGSAAAAPGSVRVLNDACRAIEKLQHRIEEVERHNLSLNENVKNCAQLIKLTQAFAEEQGRENTATMQKMEEQLCVAANATQQHTAASENSISNRVDKIEGQMAELVATSIHDSRATDNAFNGFHAEILKKNSDFEARLTELTKRHADVLYQKLDQDAKQLVSERVQSEVSAIMEKIEQMAERMMVDLSDKHKRLHADLESISRQHENAIEDRVEKIARNIEKKNDAYEQAQRERSDTFEEMKRQYRSNDTALTKSMDILQVRFEGCAADIERLNQIIRDFRGDIQNQNVSAEKTRQQMSEQIVTEIDATKSKLMKAIKAAEENASSELEASLKAAFDKEAVRFQALCRTVDDRISQAQQEVRLRDQSLAKGLENLETMLRADIEAVSELGEQRQRQVVAEMRKAVERGDADRKRLASELQTYHTNDEARVAELERRLLRQAQITHDELGKRLEDTVTKQALDATKIEERVLVEVGSVEKRISTRLDDCFAQLSTSLDLYKNVRSLCKDTGERTRNAEEAVAEQFASLEASIEKKLQKVAAAAAANTANGDANIVAKTSGDSSQRYGFGHIPMEAQVAAPDPWGLPPPQFYDASNHVERAVPNGVAVDNTMGSTGAGDTAKVTSGVERGVAGLETSIQDLKTLVRSMGTPPRKQEARSSTPMAATMRTVPSPEVEVLRRERESRQIRLQKLYKELTRLEPT